MKKTTLMTCLGILLTGAVLSGCGGGNDATINPPAAPTATIDYGIKTVVLSWGAVAGATEYKVFENSDGHSGYIEIATGLTTTRYSHEIFLPRRINASYIVAACNSNGCTDSAPVTVSSTLLEAIGYVKASNLEASDSFGWSVALSSDGTTLAVGSAWEDSAATGINDTSIGQADNSASNAGAVYIFTRSGSSWTQQAYIKASNTEARDSFGSSVALSGDGSTLAVGADREDSAAIGINDTSIGQADNSASNAGAVYVFIRSGSNWSQQAYIKASNTEASDSFGRSVALSGDGSTLAVGADREDSAAIGINDTSIGQADNSASNAGAVYIFTRSGSNWSQQAYIKASNTEASDSFGRSVALSGDGSTLAVGADREDSAAIGINDTSIGQADNSASNAGAVYIFTRSGSSWTQQAYIKASNTEAGDSFGRSVALSGDGSTLAVGADREDSVATGINDTSIGQADNSAFNAGAVYVFTRSGSNWSQQAYIKASNTQASDFFGRSVALSGDGTTLAVGADQEDSAATGINDTSIGQADNLASNAGAVYVFTRSGSSWTQQAYIKASNTEAGDSFSWSVALSSDGNAMAVGAKNEDSADTNINGDQADNSATNAGAVYLY